MKGIGGIVRSLIPEGLRPATYLRRLVLERSDGRVVDGVFAGMQYGTSSVGSVLIPKVLGIYERELYPSIERILATDPDMIVDIGAAEGYYAVGLAVRTKAIPVIAFETEQEGRRLLEQNARANGVLDRIAIHATCEVADLAASLRGAARPFVVCDVEGYERELMDVGRIPDLKRAHILLELHEFISPGVTELIRQRFTPTHGIEEIWQEDRTRNDLRFSTLYSRLIPGRFVRRIVSEKRPERMFWFVMNPKEPGAATQ